MFTDCNPLHLCAILGIIGIEIALILTGNDGAYALPLVGMICLILGVKIPEDGLKRLLFGWMGK